MVPFRVNSYNVDIAKIVGPLSSIYITYLDSCIRKSSNENREVAISRDLIYDDTGINDEAQGKAESHLINLGIIEVSSVRSKNNKNKYKINYNVLENVLNIKQLEPINQFSQTVPQREKKQVTRISSKEASLRKLKKSVVCEDEVLKSYIFLWLDSLSEANKMLTSTSLQMNIADLFSSLSSQEDRIKALEISTKNSWRDLKWAIEKLNKTGNDISNNFVNYSDIKSNGQNEVNEIF